MVSKTEVYTYQVQEKPWSLRQKSIHTRHRGQRRSSRQKPYTALLLGVADYIHSSGSLPLRIFGVEDGFQRNYPIPLGAPLFSLLTAGREPDTPASSKTLTYSTSITALYAFGRSPASTLVTPFGRNSIMTSSLPCYRCSFNSHA